MARRRAPASAARPAGGSISRTLGRSAVGAQRADQLVDLPDRLPGHLLDRLERVACGLGVRSRSSRAGAGLDQDHVDRVAGGVVQVAGDPGALLGGRQAALALGLALGAQRALLELGHPLAPQPRAVAGQPGAAPDQHAEEDLRRREATRARHRSTATCAASSTPPAERQRRAARASVCGRRPASTAPPSGPSGRPGGAAMAYHGRAGHAVNTNTASGAERRATAAAWPAPRARRRARRPPRRALDAAWRTSSPSAAANTAAAIAASRHAVARKRRRGTPGLAASLAERSAPRRYAPADRHSVDGPVLPRGTHSRALPGRAFVGHGRGPPRPSLADHVTAHPLGPRPQAHRRPRLDPPHLRRHRGRRPGVRPLKAEFSMPGQGGLEDQPRSPSATTARAAGRPADAGGTLPPGETVDRRGARRPRARRAAGGGAAAEPHRLVCLDRRRGLRLGGRPHHLRSRLRDARTRPPPSARTADAERAASRALEGAEVGGRARAADRVRRAAEDSGGDAGAPACCSRR